MSTSTQITKETIVTNDTEEEVSLKESQQSVALYTLGCKTNQLESSTIAKEFAGQGWAVVPFDEPASLYIINTCTVTERADTESQRMIRRAKLTNPDGKIAVTGCYAQVSPEQIAEMDGVNYVIGNNFKDQIHHIVTTMPTDDKPLVQVSDIDKSRIMEGANEADIGRTRGSLKIQDGCDYKCTYCIIWEARGKSRSLPAEDIKSHLQRMVWEGYKEIMLTGINIGQYWDETKQLDLAGLLREMISIDGDFRLRLTSLDPLEVSKDLVDTMADSNGKICPHFHLSAQSVEDSVLKLMARRHHAQDMVDICAYINKKMPHCSVGSDIIVGFPGETADKFEETFNTLRDCAMNYFHVFSYSKRKGTPAAEFEEQVPEREKKERAKRLRALSDEKQSRYRDQFIGQTLEVIIENSDDPSIVKGTSENYLKVFLTGNNLDALQANDKVRVEIIENLQDSVKGIVV